MLLSLLLLDFYEKDGKEAFSSYVALINSQHKTSLLARTDAIVAKYDEECSRRNAEIAKDELWMKAVQGGLFALLDDVTRRQVASMDNLSGIVKNSTSLKSQFLLALGSSVGVAVLIAFSKLIIDYM